MGTQGTVVKLNMHYALSAQTGSTPLQQGPLWKWHTICWMFSWCHSFINTFM